MPSRLASMCALLAMSVWVYAEGDHPADGPSRAGTSRVTWTTGGPGAPIRLVANSVSVDEIIDVMARNTGTRFHHDGLSREPISLDCEEADFRQLLACVLGPDADLMIRSGAAGRPGMPDWLEEVWVVSRSAGSATPHRISPAPSIGGQPNRPGVEAKTMSDKEMARALSLAGSAESEGRVQGLQRLAGHSAGSDIAARRVLQEAFVDGDPEARAQAVFGLGRDGGDEAIATLERALQDQDASVRLMAIDTIDGVGESSSLLKAALNDADETVRQLAALKLERIAAQAGATQAAHR